MTGKIIKGNKKNVFFEISFIMIVILVVFFVVVFFLFIKRNQPKDRIQQSEQNFTKILLKVINQYLSSTSLGPLWLGNGFISFLQSFVPVLRWRRRGQKSFNDPRGQNRAALGTRYTCAKLR